MRKPLIAGNWKMNHLFSSATEYFQTLSTELANKPQFNHLSVDVLLAIPSPFLSLGSGLEKRFGYKIAAQTVHEKLEGAFTGEISVRMLNDLGVTWTLVGHSERRQYYNDTDASVAKKTKTCLENGITPIVCVGETREEREAGRTEEVLARQVRAVLGEVENPKELVLAYEPVWAIGTGLTATDQQAQEAHFFIRGLLREASDELSQRSRILYGGSVKSSNIGGLMSQADIDGALVGGASLDPLEFSKIVAFS